MADFVSDVPRAAARQLESHAAPIAGVWALITVRQAVVLHVAELAEAAVALVAEPDLVYAVRLVVNHALVAVVVTAAVAPHLDYRICSFGLVVDEAFSFGRLRRSHRLPALALDGKDVLWLHRRGHLSLRL